MKKKDDRKVKMKYTGATPCRIPGIGKVEPGSTFDFPEEMSANLARDPLFTVTEDKNKTTKGTKDSNKTKGPRVYQEEKEVKDG